MNRFNPFLRTVHGRGGTHLAACGWRANPPKATARRRWPSRALGGWSRSLPGPLQHASRPNLPHEPFSCMFSCLCAIVSINPHRCCAAADMAPSWPTTLTVVYLGAGPLSLSHRLFHLKFDIQADASSLWAVGNGFRQYTACAVAAEEMSNRLACTLSRLVVRAEIFEAGGLSKRNPCLTTMSPCRLWDRRIPAACCPPTAGTTRGFGERAWRSWSATWMRSTPRTARQRPRQAAVNGCQCAPASSQPPLV